MHATQVVSFPRHRERPLFFDREPIRSKLTFSSTKRRKEIHTMTKEEYVTYIIQHTEDFPKTGEISLASAQNMLRNAYPSKSIPEITPEEFVSIWNALIHDPKVMTLE